MNELTEQDAMNLLRKVCAEFKGTLGDHQTLQNALLKIEKTICDLRAAVPKVERKIIKMKETT